MAEVDLHQRTRKIGATTWSRGKLPALTVPVLVPLGRNGRVSNVAFGYHRLQGWPISNISPKWQTSNIPQPKSETDKGLLNHILHLSRKDDDRTMDVIFKSKLLCYRWLLFFHVACLRSVLTLSNLFYSPCPAAWRSNT